MEGQLQMVLIAAGILAVLGMGAFMILTMKRTAYLGPVKEELQKEKVWLRRGEYNAAMVKGRQNLELLLKLVAEKNGIRLDNTPQAQANAKELEERQSQSPRGGKKQKAMSVMTHKQFNRWMTENGYLDRVARWEMHQVRQIGNKAVHENYADKEDAWTQFNYLEDILKVVMEKSHVPGKRAERRSGNEQNAFVKEAAPKKQELKKKQAQPKKQEPKQKQAQPKKQEPKQKQAQPKKQEPKQKQAQPKTQAVQQGEEEQVKKKRRRRRPKKKKMDGNAGASTSENVKQPKPQAQKQPKPQAQKQPKPQAQKQQPKPQAQNEANNQEQKTQKKKNNNNNYWRKRRKKKGSGQVNASGSGGQE